MKTLLLIKIFFKQNLIISGIILIGLFVRIIYINHGYPYLFNIDEPAIVRSALGLFYSSEIDRFDWPHFNFYFHHFIYIIFSKFRALTIDLRIDSVIRGIIPEIYNEGFSFYLISRILTAVLGGLTIIPVYLLSSRIFDKNTALISALIFSLLPHHIQLSHYASQDIALLFWTMWSIYLLYLTVLSKNYKRLILAGIFLGLATGVKYNVILVFLILPFSDIANNLNVIKSTKSFIKMIIKLIPSYAIILLTTLIVFLITTNNIFRNWETFWSYEYGRGFLWQLNVNSDPVALTDYPVSFVNTIKMLVDSFTIVPVFMFLISPILYKKNKMNRYLWALFLFIMLYILFIGKYNRAGPRYLLPVYGLICVNLSVYYFYFKKYWKTGLIMITIVPMAHLSFTYLNLFKNDNVIKEMYERYKGKSIYIKGDDLGNFRFLNEIGLKEYKEDMTIPFGSIIFTEQELDLNTLTLLESKGSHGFLGPENIYVYEQN